MTRKTLFIKILKGVAWTGLGLVALLGLVFAALQTQAVKGRLAAWISGTLSSQDRTVSIQGLDGWLPFEISTQSITVSDVKGTALHLEQAGLGWDPLALLTGTLKVSSLQARTVTLNHLPQSSSQVQPEQEQKPFQLPQLPPVIIESVDLPKISLGPSVAGATGVFAFQAGLALHSWQNVHGSLDLVQTDQPGFEFQGQFALEEQNLTTDMTIRERPSGFLDTLLGNSLPLPVNLTLTGQGPARTWNGSLEITSRAKSLFQGTVNVSSAKDSVSLGLKSRAWVQEFLPVSLQQVLQTRETFPLEVQVNYDKATGVVTLQTLQAQTSLARLDVSGEIDVRNKGLSLLAGLNCPDLTALQPLLPVQAEGRAALNLRAEGAWTTPDLELGLTVSDLRASQIRVPDGEITLSASLPSSLDHSAIAVTGSGQLSQVQNNDAPLTSGPVDLAFLTRYHPSGLVEIDEFRLSSGTEEILLSARLEPDRSFVSNLSVTLPHLEAQPVVKSTGLAGAFDFDAALQGKLDPATVSASLTARTTNLSGLPDQIMAIAGSHQKLTGNVFLHQDGVLSITPLDLKGPHVSVNLLGQLDTRSGELDLTTSLQGPELSLLDLTALPGLQGAVTATASCQGPWSSMQAQAEVTIQDLGQSGLKPSHLTANLTARDLPEAPAGTLDLELKRNSTSVNSSLDFSFIDRIVTIANLKLSGPQTSLSAQATWPLNTSEATRAEVSFQTGSLSWLETFIPFSCTGQAELTAEYTERTGVGHLSAQGLVKNLALPWVSIGRSDLQATVTDLESLSGNVSLTGADIDFGDMSLTSLDVSGQGDRSGADFAVVTKGHLPQPFAFKTQGSLSLSDTQTIVSLQTGGGFLSRLDFDWDQPITIIQEAGELRLPGTEINLAQGTLLLEARTSNMSAVQALLQTRDIELNDLPLDRFRSLSGRIDSDISVQGTLQDPRMQVQASISELKSRLEATSDLPPASVSLAAQYDGNRMQASLEASQTDLISLQADLTLPGALALHPFQFDPRAGLDGALTGKLDLNVMNSVLPVDGHQYGGNLDIDLQLSGPLSSPVVNGDFELHKGRYEHALTGFALTQLEVAGKIEERTLTLTTLQASDGSQGSLSGQGRLELQPDRNIEYTLSTRFDSARLIRLDMAQGSVSGDLQVTGTSDQAAVAGELSIFPLEISLPQPGPPGTSGLIIRDKEAVPESAAEQKTLPQPAEGSLLNNTDLDIGITLPQGTFVRGRGLDSEWEARLRVQGRASDPRISGQIHTVRGHLNLLTKRFTLTEGTITFANEFPPQPLLDITATHKAKDIEVMVTITGSASQPTISLDSDPAYPRDEILSQLLFNRELSTISPLQAVKLALAVRTLTSGGGEGIMDKTRNLFGLDELDVRASDQEEGTTVGVGKYVNENIYFKVEKGLDAESGRVTVDIELSPRFSVETQAGALTQGATFKWNYQY